MQTRAVLEVTMEFSQHQDEVRIIVRSADGSKLSLQNISDAIIETMMYEHGMTYISDQKLDS